MIAGGNNEKFHKKLTSAVLSAIMLLHGTNAQAETKTKPVSSQYTRKQKESKSLERKPSKLKKALKITGEAVIIGLGTYLIYKAACKIGQKIYLSTIKTIVDDMSDEEVDKFLNKQIEAFESREGGDAFKIHTSLKQQANKRSLALCLANFNCIFDRYPAYAKFIANYNRKNNRKFTFGIIPESDQDLKTKYKSVPLAYAKPDLSGIYIHKKYITCSPDFEKWNQINSVKTGSHPRIIKLNEILQSYMSHEMGHAFENCILQCINDKTSYGRIDTKTGNVIWEGPEYRIKDKIIAKAEKYPEYKTSRISDYGKTDCSEWIAETVSALINGETSTPLTRAMEEYLREMEPELEKECKNFI